MENNSNQDMTPDDVKAEVEDKLREINNEITNNGMKQGAGIKVTVDPNFNVKIQINHGGRISNINYNYYEEYDRGVSFVSGDTGTTDANNVMDGAVTQDNYYSITYNTQTSCNEHTVATTNQIVDILGLNENEDYHIFSSHSDGGTTFFNEIREYDGKYDIVVCEGAYDAKNFVDGMLSSDNEAIRNNLRENGGVIVAYEALAGHGAGDPMKAINNYMRLVDDGADTTHIKSSDTTINDKGEEPLRVIVGINQKINGHSSANGAISTSPIELFKTDEMDAIANGFDVTTYADDGSVTYDENGNPTGGVRTFENHETRYYNLNSAEFLSGNYAGGTVNGEYIVYLTDEHGRAIDRNGNITDNPDDYVCLAFDSLEELQNYFTTARAQVENQFISQGKIDEMLALSEKKFQEMGGVRGMTYQNYQTVVSDANNIINTANNTTCSNRGASDYAVFENSNSSFPSSLNNSNAFLYGITANLLSDLQQDFTSLQNVLEGKVDLENYLVNATNALNDGGINGTGADIALEGSYLSTIDPAFTEIFTTKVPQGNVGKISVNDLNTAISENGIIMSGLNNDINDANALSMSIDEFVNSLGLEGEDWETIQAHFAQYQEICKARIEADNIMKAAYRDAAELITRYISPDESMDDGQIPEYKQTIQDLTNDINNSKAEVESLKAENAQLATVGPECTSGTDKDGNPYEHCDWGPVHAAEAKISRNNALIFALERHIEVATQAREEAIIYLGRLEGFATVLNTANQMIADGMAEAQSIYGVAVDNFNPVIYG